MEEPKIEEKAQNIENITTNNNKGNSQQIAGAIIIAGLFIAGAIFLKGSAPQPTNLQGANNTGTTDPAKVSSSDRTIGNPSAKITLVLYEDFQCPFCGRFFSDSEKIARDSYVKDGSVLLVYRDFAFLGPESFKAAEAARCANDQGKFWEYHDYLFTHQNGENKGAFADNFLESFATTLGLDGTTFTQCLSQGKYTQAVNDSNTEAKKAGVNGTPKGFILKNGKLVDTIDGAQPFATVKQKLDSALK